MRTAGDKWYNRFKNADQGSQDLEQQCAVLTCNVSTSIVMLEILTTSFPGEKRLALQVPSFSTQLL